MAIASNQVTNKPCILKGDKDPHTIFYLLSYCGGGSERSASTPPPPINIYDFFTSYVHLFGKPYLALVLGTSCLRNRGSFRSDSENIDDTSLT